MAMKTAETRPVQYIDRVVDVPVDKEPSEAAPTPEVMIAVQAQTTGNLLDGSDSIECEFVDGYTRYG